MTSGSTPTAGGRLRADALHNVEEIRKAALRVFRAHGLGTALDEVARAAGVSKGTIYHRFGGRRGLIDAVVEDLVAERIEAILDDVEKTQEPWTRFQTYLRLIWMLQYDEPAVNDVLLRAHPDSLPLTALCERACAIGTRLLAEAQDAGAVRDDVTGEDLYLLIWERGIIARACDRDCDQQTREDYQRRLDYTLRGLRR